MVEIHFISVGCGNMVLIHLSDGTTMLYDCNITEDNTDHVIAYLKRAMGSRDGIGIFVCSHRDSDHMRGVKVVHNNYPIGEIWDSGAPGTTTDSPEYAAYMDLKRKLPSVQVESRTKWAFGDTAVRCMNSGDSDYPDPNDRSIVLKIQYKESSLLLAADTSFRPWKDAILPFYGEQIKSSLLLAPHHGSLTFFDDPQDQKHYYVEHMRTISPAMTIISVGPNVNDLPHPKAVELYTKYSSGSNQGNKVYRTDKKGHIKAVLKGDGAWNLWVNQ